MQQPFDEERPIFLQLKERLEEAILAGIYEDETQLPSITELSVKLQINPATALKAINLLVEENTAYKKRGVGMFVAQGATERLKDKRRDEFYEAYVVRLVREAERLGLTREDLIKMLERGMEK
ncbi:MAG TPA: GntR family transcriptional regulator [Clostridia bacterium]|nr:GntR family transcriptional regulator [Clostridia bacterium]